MGPLIAAVPAALPYIGAALAGGSALSNMSKGGGSSSQAQGQSSELANEMARISRDLYNQTNPMRENIIGRGMDFLDVPQGGQQARPPQQIQLPMTLTEKIKQHGQTITIPGVQGGMEDQAQDANPFRVDPSASPLYAPGKYSIERQFQNAEDEIMSSLPQGGALLEMLAKAQTDKAGALTGLEADISQDFFDKIYGLASGTPQTSISGIGGASSILSGIAGQQANQQMLESAGKNQALGSMGSSVGTVMMNKEG